MRRLMLAFAGLLGLSVAAAQADYFLIRINLGPGKSGKATQQQGFGSSMGPFGSGPGIGPGMGPPGIGSGGGGQSGPPGGMMQMMERMRAMRGMGGGQNQGQQTKDEDEDIYDPNSLHTDVVIEVNKYGFPKDRRGMPIPGVMRIHHKWGKSWITINDTFIAIKQIKRKSVREMFQLLPQRRKAEKTADDWVELARWALEHGLMKEVTMSMAKAKELDPNNATVKVYEQVQAALAKPAAGTNAAEFWQGKLTGYKIEQGPHYALLYHAKSVDDPKDIQTWLNELEHNYRAFFDWFALQGKAMPVPTSRLLAILADDMDTFNLLHDGLGAGTMDADAFLARRDNLAVLSAMPLDKAFIALSKSSDALWQRGFNIKDLLNAHGRRDASADENEDAQMRALALTAMRERSRVTSVSSEGTRQLAAAVGLLPREVKVPQWFQFGLGSFFETPRNAYWEGTGAPSWTYLDIWKKWSQKDKLDKPPEKALRDVVMDTYFKLPKTKPEQALLKARTMSWGLTYYLMERHLDGVFRFCAELNNLPRDMDLDPTLVMGCFSRAFRLGEGDHPEVPTTARLIEFSGEWYRFLKDKPLPCPDAGKSLDDVLTKKENPGANKYGNRGGPGSGMFPKRGR